MVKSARTRKGDSKEDYASKSYWDSRYQANDINHEWYYSFEILQPLLSMYLQNEISSVDKALEIGCGDRPLVNKFTQLGFAASSLHGIDYSKVVIDMLHEEQKKGRIDSDVHFTEADARAMPLFESNTFSVILDKGTTDAMLSSRSRKEGMNNAKQIFSEIVRMLTLNGTFVLVSHMEIESDEFDTVMSEVFMPILQEKNTVNWFVKAHIVNRLGAVDEELKNPPSKGKFRSLYKLGTFNTYTSPPQEKTRKEKQMRSKRQKIKGMAQSIPLPLSQNALHETEHRSQW
ncbi:methyltransferase domain-containing protein [archaeon]|nr:MAG: methyltransferase domain-containing protein [archaeon]